MDIAVIFCAHNKWSNKHVLFVKLKKAMKRLETEQAVNEEQQVVLTELLRENFSDGLFRASDILIQMDIIPECTPMTSL